MANENYFFSGTARAVSCPELAFPTGAKGLLPGAKGQLLESLSPAHLVPSRLAAGTLGWLAYEPDSPVTRGHGGLRTYLISLLCGRISMR